MYKVGENCPECGACLGICPVGAIQLTGAGAVIGTTCVECGICAPTCPVKLITQVADTPAPLKSTKKGGTA